MDKKKYNLDYAKNKKLVNMFLVRIRISFIYESVEVKYLSTCVCVCVAYMSVILK